MSSVFGALVRSGTSLHLEAVISIKKTPISANVKSYFGLVFNSYVTPSRGLALHLLNLSTLNKNIPNTLY